MATADVALRPRATRRRLGYILLGIVGVTIGTMIVVAATHVTAAASIIAIFVVLSGLWALAYARDGTALLTAYLVLIFVLPAPYSVSGLRSVGAPSFLLAFGLGLWWLFERIWPSPPEARGRRPIHMLLGLFSLSWVISYAVSNLSVHPGAEARAMDRSLMLLLGWMGLALATIDGVHSRDRLQALLRRIVYGGGYVALVAILQSRGVVDLARFNVPGLVIDGQASSTYDVRSGFDRVKSTTLHPIELAAVLGMVLPLALHMLLHSRTKAERRIMQVCVGLIAVAMPMAVTRTGVLAFAVALAILIPSWPRARQIQFVKIAIPGVIIMRLAIPGLLGTLKSLFTSAGQDPSVTGRTEDFPIVFNLIGRHPYFGMGPANFRPEEYFYLDNQFLGTAVELGGVGLLTLFALFIGAAIIAAEAGRRAPSKPDQMLTRALIAGLLAGFATFATFDALGFPVISSLMFLYVGAIGCLFKLNTAERAAAAAAAPSAAPRERPLAVAASAAR